MTPIKAVIVDDESYCILNLKKLIQMVSSDVEILGTAETVDEALRIIPELKPNLLFLDIEMPYLNGFELYEQLEYKDCHVIFVTAFDSYAVKAFQLNAVDYLMKPIDIDLLEGAINRVKLKISDDNIPELTQLIKTLVPSSISHLAVPTLNGLKILNFDDIIYITSDSNYCTIHLNSTDKTILVSKKIGEIQPKLSNKFARIHNQHIVNIDYIEEYIKGRTGVVILKNGIELEVSQRRKGDFLGYFHYIL